MKDQDIQARKGTYSRLHDRIWNIGYKDWNQQYTHYFLIKKNVRSNIIKTILEYLLIVVPELLKEWKIAIISVRQEYESTEGR